MCNKNHIEDEQLLLRNLTETIKKSKKPILTILATILLTLLISSLVSIWLSSNHDLHIPSLGTIRVIDVEAYGADIKETQDGKQYLDWGTLHPGLPLNRSLYLKSKSNTPLILKISISNITFKDSKDIPIMEPAPIENPFTLSWNYSNVPLKPMEETFVTLTLTASSDTEFIKYVISHDIQNFMFDIYIEAEPE